ncbi:hypothetical protein N8960_00765 [bacterium]|nr:hypothetical protein [bacterium]
MKKLILTILSTTTILGVNAQGNNLQFSQTIFTEFINITGLTTSDYINSGTFTIPANKTWKITSASCYQRNNSNSSINSNICGLMINNHNLLQSFNNGIYNTTKYPIWLPEGTYTVYTKLTSTSLNSNSSISGIEFNIIP